MHGHGEDRTLDLTVLRVPNPPFGFDIVSRSNEQFLPSYVVAKQLKMPTAVVSTPCAAAVLWFVMHHLPLTVFVSLHS